MSLRMASSKCADRCCALSASNASHQRLQAAFRQKASTCMQLFMFLALVLLPALAFNGDWHKKHVACVLKVPIDTWLVVVPQMMARLHTAEREIIEPLTELLVKIGRNHPQALMYPLLVRRFALLLWTSSGLDCGFFQPVLIAVWR